jgi:hypothetical protein
MAHHARSIRDAEGTEEFGGHGEIRRARRNFGGHGEELAVLYSAPAMSAGMRRTVFAACLLLVCGSGNAVAQAAPPPPARETQLLPRAGFEFAGARLLASDRRFEWEGRIEVDFDVVDYGTGRVRVRGDYSAVIGRERRRYDLNQVYYFFEAAASSRLRDDLELVGLISHVSRHVVDREFQPAISWNAVGARAQYARANVEGHIELTHAMKQAFVDYTWLSNVGVKVRHPISERVSVIGTAYGELFNVDHLVRDRRVCGGRIEGGLRVNGRKAAVELFAGYERRVDAYPTDRYRVRMFNLGFRVVSR